LAELGQVYLNDAFPSAHRTHASTVGITKFLPSFAGLGLAKEVNILTKLIEKPTKPFVIIVGGAKISDKIGALQNLLKTADTVLVGGGVANNFLKAQGLEIHQSYLQDTPADIKKKGINFVKMASKLMQTSQTDKTLINNYIPVPKIIFPLDVIAAKSPDSSQIETIELWHDMQDTPNDKELMYLDIGPKSIRLYEKIIAKAGTIFWNGPVGYYEKKLFINGTYKIALAVAKSSATSIIGGGDTIAAVEQFGLIDQYNHVSTAGGAGLTFLAGENMPGLIPLDADKQ
jgi:phosphoglycerate kinase